MSLSPTAAANATQKITQALVMLAWSRIWSPLVEEDVRSRTWRELDLPGSYEQHSIEYWTLFHTGDPQPLVPTVLHAALKREGASSREDWLRVIDYLGLCWNDVRLAPDQLGAACEIYACALKHHEPVLIDNLARRYLLPWCETAESILAQKPSPLLELVSAFKEDVLAVLD